MPARVTGSIEVYYEKRKMQQVKEAQNMAKAYYRAFHKIPPKKEFREFFWIFEERKYPMDFSSFDDVMKLVNNYNMSYEVFMSTEPVFRGYEAFIKSCNLMEGNVDE